MISFHQQDCNIDYRVFPKLNMCRLANVAMARRVTQARGLLLELSETLQEKADVRWPRRVSRSRGRGRQPRHGRVRPPCQGSLAAAAALHYVSLTTYYVSCIKLITTL